MDLLLELLLDLLLELLLVLLLLILGGGRALRAPLYVHNKIHKAAAEVAVPAAAPAAAIAAAPAADSWIHGSTSFIMNHIFYFEMKSTQLVHKHPGRNHCHRTLTRRQLGSLVLSLRQKKLISTNC